MSTRTRARGRPGGRSRIVVLHPRPSQIAADVARLRGAGHEVRALWPEGSPGLVPLRRTPPDAIVIDLTRQPATGQALATALRQYKDTRTVPLLFVAGDPAKTARVRAVLPDATYTSWARMRGALRDALRRPRAQPKAVVVPGTMAGYSGTPLPKKLGIKPGALVVLLGAPKGFETTLGDLPEGVALRRDPRRPARVVLLFVSTRADLGRRFPAAVGAMGDPGALWIVWPKKTSGVVSDLGEKEVRDFGLTAGLVDYKIAAIDVTWSGLCFARRKG